MIKYNKIISYSLYIGFIFSIIAIIIEQDTLAEQTARPMFTIGVLFKDMAAVFIIISGWMALYFEGYRFPRFGKYLYLIIVVWIAWVYFRDGIDFQPHNIFSVKGIGPWVSLSILFTAADKERLLTLYKLLFYALIIFSAIILFNIGKLGFGFDRITAWMLLRSITLNSIWIIPIILFSDNLSKAQALISLLCLTIIFVSSIIIATRSFIIICVLDFILYLFINRLINLLKILLFVFILIPLLYFLFPFILETNYGKTMQTGLSILEHRIGTDSRYSEIKEFTQQMKYSDLLIGAGTDSGWKGYGSNHYQWLDNQWLLTAWWAGLIPAICYFLLLVKPLASSLFTKEKGVFANGFTVLLWILACAGLSIYTVIVPTFYFFVVSMSTGISLYNYKHKIKITYDRNIND